MKILAIVLLVVGLGFIGLGIGQYVSYDRLRTNALSRLEKAKELYSQASAKQGTDEGDKLIEEAEQNRRDASGILDSAEQPKGYMTMNLILSGVAFLLSILFFILHSRRRRAARSAQAHSAAYYPS